ncbi:MAG: response regulator transcription factor [Prevotella sp.]|nr:response regulator transcription factor [Prevotella sp.]
MKLEQFKVIIVEDVPLELKGTEGILRSDIPEAQVIGTADSEAAYWKLMREELPQLVLLDLGLGGSTTIGVEICRQTKEKHKDIKVLIFTGEILNEKLWVDVLDAGADGIILKSGEMLTRNDVCSVMGGKRLVFNQPILKKIIERFAQSVNSQIAQQESLIDYEIDEYDERFLRHLALGYTKEQISNLRGMPFGVKSLEKRQNELVQKLFPNGNGGMGVNATRLVVKAMQLHILDVDNLYPDED